MTNMWRTLWIGVFFVSSSLSWATLNKQQLFALSKNGSACETRASEFAERFTAITQNPAQARCLGSLDRDRILVSYATAKPFSWNFSTWGRGITQYKGSRTSGAFGSMESCLAQQQQLEAEVVRETGLPVWMSSCDVADVSGVVFWVSQLLPAGVVPAKSLWTADLSDAEWSLPQVLSELLAGAKSFETEDVFYWADKPMPVRTMLVSSYRTLEGCNREMEALGQALAGSAAVTWFSRVCEERVLGNGVPSLWILQTVYVSTRYLQTSWLGGSDLYDSLEACQADRNERLNWVRSFRPDVIGAVCENHSRGSYAFRPLHF